MQKNIFILSATLFLSLTSFASIPNLGAVSTATGGTGRGAVEAVDGIYLNPAFIRDFTSQNFSYNYGKDAWALSISDSGEDSFFPAAIQLLSQKTDLIDTQKLGLTLATPRWRNLVLGATTSLVEYTDKTGALIDNKYRQGMVDLGVTLALSKNVGVGFVANKVSSSNVKLIDSLQVQKSMGFGISYTMENFARFRADVESAPDFKTDRLIYMVGLENYINDWVIFRLGFQNNKVLSKDFITAGLGFAGPQFTLHYAYIADASDQTDQKHLFDLGIPF